MLAPLHHAALGDVPADKAGMAAGLYSMLRFMGSVVGTAVAGVLLQSLLDRSVPTLVAYQHVFRAFVLFSVAGMIVALGLDLRKTTLIQRSRA